MRGPNSCRPLRATSPRLVILLFLACSLSPAFARTVDDSRHHHHRRHQLGESVDGLAEESNSRTQPVLASDGSLPDSGRAGQSPWVDEGVEKSEDLPADGRSSEKIDRRSTSERGDAIEASGKSKKKSSSTIIAIDEAGSSIDRDGIRRFDAVVVGNEETLGNILASDKSKDRSIAENAGIGKTVTKGIIVRDGPISDDDVPSEKIHDIRESLTEVRAHRKRSVDDLSYANAEEAERSANDARVEASVVNGESGKADRTETGGTSVVVAADNAETAKRSSSDETLIETDEKTRETSSGASESERVDESAETELGELAIVEQANGFSVSDVGQARAIDKLIVSDDERAQEDAVDSEIGERIVPGNRLGNDDKDSKERVSNSRTFVLDAVEGKNRDDGSVGASRNEALPNVKVTRESVFDSFSLSNILNTNVSLNEAKSQAIALQAFLKDKTFLERLRDRDDVLPQIPKFTEAQLSDALDKIATMKDIGEDADDSFFTKMNTSALSADQLKIVRCAEGLVARDQRQTFAENMLECVRGLSILNCMRIFVWPLIADNIPESFGQNLPTLPIEVNVADWLPGNRRETSRASTLRSKQRGLVTPELLVSDILKEALITRSRNATNLPTFVDPKNETMAKLLTPGQLEILRMAETFLPDSSRREYAEKMYSCVRRFEYFSCVKYFAWPIVKQHFADLPDFPDYQSWYPNASLRTDYPIVSYPTAEEIGESPEIVEADATRTSHPRPETVIVQILADTLKQTPRVPHHPPVYYSSAHVGLPLSTVTADQMAIFYTAEQLMPEAMRSEFISKTIECIRDYDYLTCTKYSTWPTVRQLYPGLPQFPDFSSWIPTFALPQIPDFSQYIPDFGSYLPNLPGFPGGGSSGQQQPQPQPQPEGQSTPQPVPDEPPSQSADTPNLAKEDNGSSEIANAIENRVIRILSNIKFVVHPGNSQPVSPITQGTLATMNSLSYSQLRILALSKSVVPVEVRGDLDARLVGCLQGGSDFLNCTKNVIWPTLRLYVKNMPSFPQADEPKLSDSNVEPTGPFTVNSKLAGLPETFVIAPAIYQPVVRSPVVLTGRSPLGSEIVAESEEQSPSSIARTSFGIPSNAPASQSPVAHPRQGITEKSGDSPRPVISVTDTRFTPIFSEHPESVILKILTNVRSSIERTDDSEIPEASIGHLESLGDHLSLNELSIIRVSENLLPASARPNFIEKMSKCSKESNFMVCARDVLWPTVTQYYPRLPSFPNFNISEDATRETESLPAKEVPGVAASSPAISETDVKTGQHGDAVVTITDTRFVPIFTQHPEELILDILTNLQTSLPASSAKQNTVTKTPDGPGEFSATFTDQQGNIITIAGNLLPESIREVFDRRMTECAREKEFLECTRDIAWPTIAQFFPRLPNFPQIVSPPELIVKPSQSPTLLPLQLEPGILAVTSPGEPSLALPTENFIPISPEDEVESRIESILKQISSVTKIPLRSQQTYLSSKDPLVGSLLTQRQAIVVRMCEDLLPNTIKPIFIGKIVECSRLDLFPNCIRNVGWPTLRQFIPGIPEFPNLGSYFPQIPQEVPQFPQFPNYPLPPQVPNFPSIGAPGQAFLYPFRAPQERVSHHRDAAYVAEGSLLAEGQPGGLYVSSVQGLTPSVDSSSASGRRTGSAGGYSRVVRAEDPSDRSTLLSGQDTTKKLAFEVISEGRRKKRSLEPESPHDYQDVSTDDVVPFNMTESEFLELLVNLTQQRKNEAMRNPEDYYVESLNTTVKEALTADQYRILKIVQDINEQTSKAGYMAKIVQCIRSLSFLRCMGIFVWPVVTQNLPSFLGFPALGSLDPFGGHRDASNFHGVFGMTSDDFERELLQRKENVEGILVDWYRGLVEEKFDRAYGYMRVRGYGDGAIGISFNSLGRTGRVSKIKDNKNLPSILTIISDIMEDMLEQRDSRPEIEKKRERGKKSGRSRGPESLIRDGSDSMDHYNEVFIEKSRRDASNDDKIIAMFIDKLRANGSNDEKASVQTNNHMSVAHAYEAFELLFGTKLSDRMAERLDILSKQDSRLHLAEDSWRKLRNRGDRGRSPNGGDEERNDDVRSGLTLRLPRIDEEFLDRKLSTGLTDLGRKMKNQMTRMVPGMSFLISFFAQMMLAHARAAATVAGMMSNMALASAMFSMIRQSLFGSVTNPKIKYVYENSAMGPGITWPQYYHKP